MAASDGNQEGGVGRGQRLEPDGVKAATTSAWLLLACPQPSGRAERMGGSAAREGSKQELKRKLFRIYR